MHQVSVAHAPKANARTSLPEAFVSASYKPITS
jgi:hypothetical protein